jgi:NADP-dependent 3-hydroxy acid dehydrogenase YdfG
MKRSVDAQGLGGSLPTRGGRPEIAANLRRIEAAGSRVIYRSVDIRDRDAVAAIMDESRQYLGPVRGLILGAGVWPIV